MTHVRQRLSLLALGVVAAALAFAAIAVSGSPTAAAFEEQYYPQGYTDCEISYLSTGCSDITGFCKTTIRYECSDGYYWTSYGYPDDNINTGPVPGCYIGIDGFNYCP